MRAMSARIALSVTASREPGIALPVKTRLGAYEVEALIAHGAFAIVYRAYDPARGRVVAIKEYFPEALALRRESNRVAPRSPAASLRFGAGRRAFLDEARLLARFDHPSLVRILDVFVTNGTAYQVMRFTPGPTLLAHRVALGRMPAVEDFRRWVGGLLEALVTLHSAGCVHGAVAPANILLQPGERPLLLVFAAERDAIARHGRTGAVHETGEPSARPDGRKPSAGDAVGAAADVQAFASVVRYCIDGGVRAEGSLADAWRREGGPEPIPRDIARLLDALEACLSKGPQLRPQDMVEFRRRLDPAAPTSPLRVVGPVIAGGQDRRGRAPEPGLGAVDPIETARRTEAGPLSGLLTSRGTAGDAGSPRQMACESGDEMPAEREAGAAVRGDVEAGAEVEAAEVETPVLEVPVVVGASTPPPPMPPEPPRAAAMPETEPAAAEAADEAAPPTVDARAPQLSAVVSTTEDPVARRSLWPRRLLAGVAAAASLMLAIAVAVRGPGQADPQPAQPASVSALDAAPAADPRTVSADPSPALVQIPAPPSKTALQADARPAAAAPGADPARALVSPPQTPGGPAATGRPAAARKTVAAAAKTKPPHEVCDGRKGFALYQCMQLQCAKPASSDHADCAPLK
jgi:hypothetical protein